MGFQSIDTLGRLKTFQVPSEVSFTTTGTINNLDFSNADLIRMNNASAAIITGFKAGYAGQRFVLQNIGSSTVQVSHQGGTSDAANRNITVSTNGQIVGGGGSLLAVYDGTTLRWRISVVDPGDWIAIAFSAGNFTANGTMTWTVAEADQATFRFRQHGMLLTVLIFIVDSTVGGALNTTLKVAVPGGFTLDSTKESPTVGIVTDNGTVVLGTFARFDDTTFALKRFDSANWSAATDTTRVFFGADVAVV